MEFENNEKFIAFPYNESIKVSQYGRVMYNGRILLQTIQNGYLVVEIPSDENQIEKVHRLVALTWQEDIFKKDIGLVVHHKDFDKMNNCADNLQWMTDDEHKSIHDIPKEDY